MFSSCTQGAPQATAQQICDHLNATIDGFDGAAFGALFREDGKWQFGNNPLLDGREAVAATCSGFFSSIKALRHFDVTVNGTDKDDTFVANGLVEYTRHSGSTLVVPWCNVIQLAQPIAATDPAKPNFVMYKTFVDVSKLYAEE